MKIEIWSDVMCPFCYIGKRHLEKALEQMPEKSQIDIEWKSYQLDPTIPMNLPVKQTVTSYLAERKGISLEQSEQMHQQVVQMAANAGLDFRFDKAIVANSFNAHKIIQLAKSKGLGDAMEEIFFKAYFTDGIDLSDEDALIELGAQAGLSCDEVTSALDSDDMSYAVNQDIQEARSFNIQGVPFFIIDRKYGISGAQPTEVFSRAITQAFSEWKATSADLMDNLDDGATCDIDGNCN